MDHFARPDDELAVAQRNRTLHRNFQGYTTKAGADLYGMGVSAISASATPTRRTIAKSRRIPGAVERRGIATMRGYRLSAKTIAAPRRDWPSALPRRDPQATKSTANFRISFDEYFAAELARLEELAHRRARDLDAGEIRVTPLGRIFIRNVGHDFRSLSARTADGQRPLFSKTL